MKRDAKRVEEFLLETFDIFATHYRTYFTDKSKGGDFDDHVSMENVPHYVDAIVTFAPSDNINEIFTIELCMTMTDH